MGITHRTQSVWTVSSRSRHNGIALGAYKEAAPEHRRGRRVTEFRLAEDFLRDAKLVMSTLSTFAL
jgi:hypothetical protein